MEIHDQWVRSSKPVHGYTVSPDFIPCSENYVIRGNKNISDSWLYVQTQLQSLQLSRSSNDTECAEAKFNDSDVVRIVSYTKKQLI